MSEIIESPESLYLPNHRGLFFTPRYSGDNAAIEVLFTADAIALGYLLEGRMTGLSTSTSNGYLNLQSSGFFESGYQQTSVRFINAQTNLVTSMYQAGVPYIMQLGGIPAGKRLTMFGTHFCISEFFNGQIHAIKTTGWFMGSNNTGADETDGSGGLASDLHFQFDHISKNPAQPSLVIDNRFSGYTPTVVAIQPQNGWQNNPTFTEWLGSTNNTLLLGDTTIYSAGARPYHRMIDVSFTVALNGNTGKLQHQRPNQSSIYEVDVVEGANRHLIFINANTMPSLQFSSANGVAISNLSVFESQDAVAQVATWRNVT